MGEFKPIQINDLKLLNNLMFQKIQAVNFEASCSSIGKNNEKKMNSKSKNEETLTELYVIKNKVKI